MTKNVQIEAVDVNHPDEYGYAPLTLVILCDLGEVFDAFLERPDLDGSYVDANGFSFLHVAAHVGSAHFTRLILEHLDVDPELVNRMGKTALDIARDSGYNEVVVLLEKNA